MARLMAGNYRIAGSLLTVGQYLQTYRGPEMGLRGEHGSGTSYAPAGQTLNRAGHRPAFRV